jgi:hypothetical protein
MYQVVKPKPGCPPLPEVCIGLITSFQDQRDRFFLCCQPERYFWEYREGEKDSNQYNINIMKTYKFYIVAGPTKGNSQFTDNHLINVLLNLQSLDCGYDNRNHFTDKGLAGLIN